MRKGGNALEVLRHLNLARNYQANDAKGRRAKKIMARDVEYMKGYYKRYKKTMGMVRPTKRKSKRRRRR